MKISKLNIDKIIIHQIHQRDEEGSKIEPTRGSSFIKFDDDALQGFKSRVIDALGDGSKAVKMQIKEQGKDYVPYISTTLVDKEGEDYIDETYYKETISLNEVADAVNMSANYLSAIFSQNMQKTFVEYITCKRVDRAKKLLRETDKSSGEIAQEVGYKDPHYFSYVFKKKSGCSPREYRSKGTV